MISLATGQILVAGFIGRAHRIPPCDAVNDLASYQGQNPGWRVGAPWNLYVTLIISGGLWLYPALWGQHSERKEAFSILEAFRSNHFLRGAPQTYSSPVTRRICYSVSIFP